MAINQIFAPDRNNSRARVVPAGTKSGDPLLINDRPAVAETDRGDATRTETTFLPPGVTSLTYQSGGQTLDPDQATVNFDGTFEFEVTGITDTTGNDVAVYITSAGDLTLTEGSNTLFGHTDYPESYKKIAGRGPVRIGA